MEDWQHHSLEEKVDLQNLVLLPPEPYSNKELNEYNSYEIKEEPCGNSIVINNLDHTDIKTEKIELDEQESNANEFSTNKKESCQICGLEFGSKTAVKIHNSLIHPKQNKDDFLKPPVISRIEKSKYLSKDSTEIKAESNNDYEVGTKSEILTVPCDPKLDSQAGSSFDFVIKDPLEIRESVHEGIKPLGPESFKCKICPYKTALKSNFKKHKESVHQGIKPFNCNNCRYETAYKKDLKRHKELAHEGFKPFKCNICEHKTTNKSDLKRHIESVHERKKPFKCTICEDEFAEKASLINHIKNHRLRIKRKIKQNGDKK